MISSAFSGTRRFFSVAPTPRALHAHRRGGDHGEGEAAQCGERRVVAAPVEAEHDVVCARGDVNGDEPRRHHPDRPLPAFHGCRPPGVVGGAEDRDSGTAHPHRRRGLTVIEVGAFRITDLAVMLAALDGPARAWEPKRLRLRLFTAAGAAGPRRPPAACGCAWPPPGPGRPSSPPRSPACKPSHPADQPELALRPGKEINGPVEPRPPGTTAGKPRTATR